MKDSLKASALAYYEAKLTRYIVPLLGSRQVASLRCADCRDLVARMRAKGLKVRTIRGIARTLSTILTQAVEDELLMANPALRLGKYLRQADAPEPEIRPFTRDEATSIVLVARERFPEWHPWLLCGLRTGMRAGEPLGCNGAISTGSEDTSTSNGTSSEARSRLPKPIRVAAWTCRDSSALRSASGVVKSVAHDSKPVVHFLSGCLPR